MNHDDRGGLIVVNVINCNEPSFLAPAGIIRIQEGERLFRYMDVFDDDSTSRKAMDVLTGWPLYKRNPDLQEAMTYFVRTAYTPAQILYMKKKDLLTYMFIPIQQKFRIGRYVETVNWDQVRVNNFAEHLSSMRPGDHITYIAMIPKQKTSKAMFYSIGTKPHQETEMSLRSEPFNFVPSHGGHIKALKSGDGSIEYLVDAGSNFLGRGTGTSMETAKTITTFLCRLYGNLHFIPVEGRGAFGTEQSY